MLEKIIVKLNKGANSIARYTKPEMTQNPKESRTAKFVNKCMAFSFKGAKGER